MQIFNNPFKTTESWTAQGAVLEYGIKNQKFSKVPLVIQGLSMQYGQQAAPIFPINTDGNGQATRINVKGAPSGQLTFNTTYSPVPGTIKDFIQKASRDCVTAGNELVITLRPFGDIKCAGRTATDKTTFTLTGVDLVSLGITIQGGEVTLVQMPLSFTFTTLDMD